MTQQWLGQITNTEAEDGDDLAARLNAFDTAHKTNQAGPSRPPSIAAGGIWTRENGDGTRTLMVWDGTADREVLMEQAASEPGLAWLKGAQVPFIVDASVTDGSIDVGLYAYATTEGSTGGPATVSNGNLLHLRRGAVGGEVQILVPDLPTAERDRLYWRSRVTGGWSTWNRAISKADDYLTADWQAGTETELAAISPAKLAAAISAQSGGEISTTTISDDTFVDVPLPTGYRQLILELRDVAPSTSGALLRARLETSGGVVDTTDSYSFLNVEVGGYYDVDDHVRVTGFGIDPSRALDGQIRLTNARDSSHRTLIVGDVIYQLEGQVYDYGGHFTARRLAADDDISIRLYCDTGNLASGTLVLFGLR